MTTERHYTAEEAAALLKVPKSIIKVWKYRQRVTPVAIADIHQAGTRSVPLYRLDELRPLADAWHARHASGS